MREGHASHTQAQVQVRFESFHPSLIGTLPENSLLIPTSVCSSELRELLTSLFLSKELSFDNFDFSIDGQFLSGSLGSFLARNSWSHENLLTILIIPRIQKPKSIAFSLQTDDWVSSIAPLKNGASSFMAFGDYSGKLHFVDSLEHNTISSSLLIDGEMPIKSVLATPSSSYLVVSHKFSSSLVSMKSKEAIMGVTDGHSNTIESAAIMQESQSSILFATGSFDRSIRISEFNLSPIVTSSTKIVLEGHSGAVTGLASACSIPSGMASGGVISPSLLISASLDGSSRHWDLVKEEMISTTAHGVPLLGIALCPSDPNLMASPAADLTVRLWDARQKNSCFKSLHGHKLLPTAVVFSKSSTSGLYSVGQDGVIKTWDLRITGKRATSDSSIGETVMQQSNQLFSLALVEEAGKFALAVGGDQGLQLVSIE
ncbi:ribosome biogenesis protein ytm1 [Mitosporidium daphniae]|uniref:Ribosome biogenesis protein Ytm1 n=1 Tax=Mitosporidium daphniae TaxID=1485682 RepID=A0A098VUQ1_9MICR|nr:ribosome biogenesis protein Ytm1 [Mitosporidium daphniae]KGG52702.1 ribosome biogenesis protein Ytm1 [Mitosporidium daphniae]|eukprot:XP_013239138.1 ribosome biogenesis protein Ytm1 [Mitosporidium daphniae]